MCWSNECNCSACMGTAEPEESEAVVFGECKSCGEKIFCGEECCTIGDKHYHRSCVSNFSVKEILDLCDGIEFIA